MSIFNFFKEGPKPELKKATVLRLSKPERFLWTDISQSLLVKIDSGQTANVDIDLTNEAVGHLLAVGDLIEYKQYPCEDTVFDLKIIAATE